MSSGPGNVVQTMSAQYLFRKLELTRTSKVRAPKASPNILKIHHDQVTKTSITDGNAKHEESGGLKLDETQMSCICFQKPDRS